MTKDSRNIGSMTHSHVKKLVALSTISQVAGQILNAVAGIVILKTLTSSLGVQSYGLYATILAFVSTFSLLTDLGLNGITGRDIAKRPQDASSIISHNMGLRLFLCVVIIPIILAFSYLLYPQQGSMIHTGILIASVYLIFDAIRAVSLAYFTAKIRNDIAAIVGVIQQFTFLILVLVVAFQNIGLYGFLGAYVASNFVAAVVSLIVTKKEVQVVPRINLRIWRSIIARSISLGIIIVINMMYLKADSIMISVLRGTDEVAIYGIAYSLILMIMAVPSYLMTSLIPSMTTSKEKDLSKIVQRAFHVMSIFSCLLIIGSLAVKNSLVLVIADKQFAAAATPFAILAIASAFSALNYVFGFASVSVNKHHKMVFVSLASLVLNILINFVLIPKYGYNGAAIATVFSELIALIGVYLVFHKETGISVRLIAAVKPIIAAIPVLISCLLLNKLWHVSNGFVDTLISGTFVVTFYTILLYLLKGLPADVYQFINSKLRKLISG